MNRPISKKIGKKSKRSFFSEKNDAPASYNQ